MGVTALQSRAGAMATRSDDGEFPQARELPEGAAGCPGVGRLSSGGAT